MQRCLAKAISLHGIGLYIYAGEDLPEEETKETKAAQEIKETAVKVKPSSTKITPTAGAMDAFTKEEQELLHVIAENLTHLTETDQLEECANHGKKLEAFCEKDHTLLCIDCILSD